MFPLESKDMQYINAPRVTIADSSRSLWPQSSINWSWSGNYTEIYDRIILLRIKARFCVTAAVTPGIITTTNSPTTTFTPKRQINKMGDLRNIQCINQVDLNMEFIKCQTDLQFAVYWWRINVSVTTEININVWHKIGNKRNIQNKD